MSIVIKSYPVDSTEMDYMQYLFTEKELYKEIMGEIIVQKNKGYSYNIENYKHFMSEYRETMYAYNTYSLEMLKKYAPKYVDSPNHEVRYNFDTKELEILPVQNKGCNHGSL